MFKLDLEPLAPRLLQNRDVHIKYLKYAQEQADTCPNAIKLNEKKVAVTPKNKVKKVSFAEPLTSSSNSKQVESSKTSDSNTPVLSSTRLKCSTSKCGSNANSNLNCATCKKSLFDDIHDKCLLDFVKIVNSHAKSAKKHKKNKIFGNLRVMYSLK
ncbi:hypothetical protein Tco_0760321 [Tanacetum coccineum]